MAINQGFNVRGEQFSVLSYCLDKDYTEHYYFLINDQVECFVHDN